MSTIKWTRRMILLLGAWTISIASFSQSEVLEVLKAGKADANLLGRAYISPYAMALGDGMNNGWYNTAKTHKLFGFDLTISVSGIPIPGNEKSFDLNALNMTNLVPKNPANHIAPTIASTTKGDGVRMNVLKDNKVVSEFTTPEGIGLGIVPVPVAQIGFGLLPYTDIIGRFIPKIKYDNDGDEIKLGLWGVGIKHNFKEWIPGIKSLPFDAAIFGSYSKLDAQSDVSLGDTDFNSSNSRLAFGTKSENALKFETTATKVGLILSKQIGILTVFGSVSQCNSETNAKLAGEYIVETKFNIGGNEIIDKDVLLDPIDQTYKTNNIGLDAGIRLKLAFFSLFGSVSKAQYTSYSAGLSFGFR